VTLLLQRSVINCLESCILTMFNKDDDDDDDDDSSLKWRLGIFYSDVFGLTPFTHTHTHTLSLSSCNVNVRDFKTCKGKEYGIFSGGSPLFTLITGEIVWQTNHRRRRPIIINRRRMRRSRACERRSDLNKRPQNDALTHFTQHSESSPRARGVV